MERFTLSPNDSRRLIISNGADALAIEGWDEQQIEVEADGRVPTVREDGEAPVLENAAGNLRLRVPRDLSVVVEHQDGSVSARGFAALTGERIAGDVRVETISGDVRLRDLSGHLTARGAAALTLEDGPSDTSHSRRDRGVKDVDVRDVATVDLENVGGSLTIAAARTLTVQNVGGEAAIHRVEGNVRIGNIGGNCKIADVGGELALSNVGGEADIHNVAAIHQLGNVGGALRLRNAPVATTAITDGLHLAVGGSARIELPDEANIRIEAMVGGSVTANGSTRGGPGMATIVYGDGAARLHLIAGGDIELIGGGTPAVSSAWGGAGGFGAQWAMHGPAIGESFSHFGEQMGQAFGQAFRSGSAKVKEANAAREHGGVKERAAATGVTVRLDDGPQTERQMILRMVASGRITAEEAARLLDALS